MNAAVASLRGRIESLHERIAAAAERSGRSSSDVVLIGVTKTFPAEVVRNAMAAGLDDLAENRVQEAERKLVGLEREGVRWHLVGHLQSNKAARAAALFDRVHGVDDAALGGALARHAAAAGKTLSALVQVNASGEASKSGVPPADLEPLLESLAGLAGLAIDGLMTIGPLVGGERETRDCFARARAARDDAERRLGLELPHLSMGMSADFEWAIEEGSTMVRIGTALFGERG